MGFLKMLIDANASINEHMGLIIVLSWFTVWIIIFCIMTTIANIIMLIKTILNNKKDKREHEIKQRMANQYIYLSNKFTDKENADEALRVMKEGCEILLKSSNNTPLPIIFGSAEGIDESDDESSIPGTAEESVSE